MTDESRDKIIRRSGSTGIRCCDVWAGLTRLTGFKKYTLLPIEQDLPFLLLQSLDDAEVSFVLAYPYAFKPDYTFEISDEDRELLKIEAEMEVVTYAIVTMNDYGRHQQWIY